MSGFVHLHVHTEYSLLDGACRIKELISRVKELGQTAVAITDHGVMYGAIDFFKEAKKQGIKPIIGCEVYVAPRNRLDKVAKIDNRPYHLILLCKNQTGYKNLSWLVSRGFTEGFYNKPRIDRELLKEHSDGLICLSACLAGEVPRRLSEGNYEAAKEAAEWYRDTFGRDNYFIEVQNHNMPEQAAILPGLVRLSQELGVGLAATNDAHYLTREDHKMHHLLLCIQTGHTIHDNMQLEFPTQEFYIKSAEEMREAFSNLPSAIENTAEIAERCNLEFEFGATKLPAFTPPGGEDNKSYFYRLCREGLVRRYGQNPPEEIVRRLDYELGVIDRMGYINYYLIVYDFIRYAKSVGIPVGPGRGSGAGSLAAYCIGITGIDPIRFQLLFERFLNPERVSMPDFDIDFCYVRRPEVIEYVNNKYGADHVAQIVTFGTMAARGAVRDVGRAMGLLYQQVDQVAKMIPNELHITLQKALDNSRELREACENDPQIAEMIEMAKRVEGMPRHASTHAAGVVITPEPVETYVPLARNDESTVTQYTMTTLEELGLLKMDFLGLRNLTVIDDAEKLIRKTSPDFSIETISLDDRAVFQMLSEGESGGVFQFESDGMRRLLSQLQPESLEDLIAAISLYRPGPMESIPRYIENRHNPGKITYKTPQLKAILEVTYGCIVYQEQVMQICRELGGYSYGQADLVRRAMSKKKADVMEKERVNFIAGCAERAISREIANSIFDEMSSFAAYAFNKSHAAAYAIVAYRTAYLRCHYPREYMAALLTSILDNTDKVIEYINECTHLGIRVLPPDINLSDEGFTVVEEDIRFGLLAVKNLGMNVIRSILTERRASGNFRSFQDFCQRLFSSDLNKRGIESLIKSGALDCLGAGRRQMLMAFPLLSDQLAEEDRWRSGGQISLFGEETAADAFEMPDLEEYTQAELLAMEKEVTGLYISGHPMSQFEPLYERFGAVRISRLNNPEAARLYDNSTVEILALLSERKLKLTKSGQNMAIMTVEDMTGSLEVMAFARVYDENRVRLTVGEPLSLRGRISLREDESAKMVLDSVMTVEERMERRHYGDREGKPAWWKDKKTEAASRNPSANHGLYLTVPSLDCPQMERIQLLLSIFEGRTPIFFRAADSGKKFRAPERMWVDANDMVMRELSGILGPDNVKRIQ